MAATSTMAPRPLSAIPKVPSLLFDMEMEDSAAVAAQCDQMEVHMVETELRRFLCPSSDAMVELIREVEKLPPSNSRDVEHLDRALREAGYLTRVVRAVGGGEGASCLHNLRHTFLSVSKPGAGSATGTTFIVDPAFSEQFLIAKPTERYTTILACIPEVLVLPEERIPPLVTFLCAELTAAFKSMNAVLPPWRQAHSMLSKWQPRKSLELDLRTAVVAPRISFDDSASGMPQAAWAPPADSRAPESVPLRIIPSKMEPHKVFGGFGAHGYINQLAS